MGSVSSYFKKIAGIDNFKLVIVGQDPYPQYATGIPFSKPSWNDLKKNHSGHYVFASLAGPDYSEKFETPDEFVMFLADKKIALLNASYDYMQGQSPSKKRHLAFVEKAMSRNMDVINKAGKVLLCGGKTTKMCGWVGVVPDNEKIFAVPHPAPYGRQNEEVWKNYWDDYALSKV
jgi:uracil DNA glycosylase